MLFYPRVGMDRLSPLVAGRTITPDQVNALHQHLQNLALQRLEMGPP